MSRINGSLFVKYRSKVQPTNVTLQVNASASAISSTLGRMNLPFKLKTVVWILLPSAIAPPNVGIPKENIHDAARVPGPFETLTAAIIGSEKLKDGPQDIQSLVPIFARELNLTLTPDSFGRRGLVGYLSDSNPDFQAISSITVFAINRPQIYIDGPAGSGKTQIGLQLALKAAREGRSAAICTHTNVMRDEFGRGLGGAQIPEGVLIVSAPYKGRIIIGTILGVAKYIEWDSEYFGFSDVDTVVIEEAHAIPNDRIDALVSRLSVGIVPHIYLLADSRQHIHKRQNFSINYALAHTYRIPRKICEFLNDLHKPEYAVSTLNRYDGNVFIEDGYDSDEEATEKAIDTVREMISDGLNGNQVAVLIGSN